MYNRDRRSGRGVLTLVLLAILCAILIYRANNQPDLVMSEDSSLLDRIGIVLRSDWNRVFQKGALPVVITAKKAADPMETPVPDVAGKELPNAEAFRYYYTLLNPTQQSLYETIASAVAERQASLLYMVSLSFDEVTEALEAVALDYPEFFWFNGEGRIATTSLKAGSFQEITFRYTMNDSQITDAEIRLEGVASAVTRDLKDKSPYEKVKGVYEYLITHTEYDISTSKQQSIVPVLLEGYGVCASYAKSFQYLLLRLGVDVIYVHGMADNSRETDNHAWNIVRIGGDFYNVDVTWGATLLWSPKAR